MEHFLEGSDLLSNHLGTSRRIKSFFILTYICHQISSKALNSESNFGYFCSLGVPENPDEILDENIMAGTRWMNKDELTEKFNGEKIIRTDVEYLHQSFDRLVQLPFSYRAKDFVFM